MKVKERDELLIRLDERSLNSWRVLSEADDSLAKKMDTMIEHQVVTNGNVLKNTVWRRITVSIYGTLIVAFILHLIGIY